VGGGVGAGPVPGRHRGKKPGDESLHLDCDFTTFQEMLQIEALEVETDDSMGLLDAREAGEGNPLSSAPAIVNAVYDACAINRPKPKSTWFANIMHLFKDGIYFAI
jgi:hypothetical protein